MKKIFPHFRVVSLPNDVIDEIMMDVNKNITSKYH